MKHFDTLGLMIDCSRNAVMKPEEVKRLVDLMARMGYNELMLYTEDTYEVGGEPFFGYLRGRYTKQELKDLDAYCASKGVALVPCVQMLAHLGSVVRWEPYGQISDCMDIIMIGEERTYTLIRNILSSLRECFRTDKLHIGMDEAHFVGLGRYLKKHGPSDRLKIMQEHLARICEMTKEYGFKPMMWNDMFFRLSDGTEETYQMIRESMPEDLSLVYWDYYHKDEKNYEDKIRQNKKICDNVRFAGGAWCWSGFAPHNAFSIDATRAAFAVCAREGVRDVMLTAWGDDGHECSRYANLPSIAWGAALAENPNADEEYVRARFAEWTGESYDDFMQLESINRIHDDPYSLQNPCKYLLYNDPFLGFMDSTVAQESSERFRRATVALEEAAGRSRRYSYLFTSLAKLSYVLELKCDLGIRTRAAYESSDREALKKIAQEYLICKERLEGFFEAFRKQWYTENKPHGFDIQEHRIGGLALRWESCAKRLLAYANGEIDRIDELHEEILPYMASRAQGEGTIMNIYMRNVSPNVSAPFYSPLC